MITVEALQSAIKQRVNSYNQNDWPLCKRPASTCSLSDSLNQILAEYVISSFAMPRQNLSAMDGYAIAHNSNLPKGGIIEIIGESQAGVPYIGKVKKGQGIRIFTGAVVPDRCDTVIMQENTNFPYIKDNIDKTQPYDIILSKAAEVDANIRKQGEEIQKNELVLQQGKRINPADISLLANLGIGKVKVFKPLTVGLLATGNELIALSGKLKTLAQIYNSNTPTLKSLLDPLPIVIHDYGIVPDDMTQITTVINKAMRKCDVLISTAGVSVGDYDFLTPVIEHLGQINHYKVAMKPGKPFVFGELTKNVDKPVLYFGLPGNPLSTVVSTLQFVIPALWQLSGASLSEQPKQLNVQALLMNDILKSTGRTDFQSAILTQNEKGNYQVDCFSTQQSHRIKQLSRANCFVVLPQNAGNISAGEQVRVQPFPWVFHS